VAKFIGSGATAAARLKRGLLGTKAGLKPRALRDKLGGRLGGGAGGNGKATDAVGTKTPKGTVEDGVAPVQHLVFQLWEPMESSA